MAEDEIEILHPERELTLNGEQVVVNEFTFIQGMKAGSIAQPLIADMDVLFRDDDAELDGGASYDKLVAMFEKHHGVVIQLLCMATGKKTEWFDRLSDTDGQSLLMTFWSVNKSFFINRLLIKGTARSQAAALASEQSTAH